LLTGQEKWVATVNNWKWRAAVLECGNYWGCEYCLCFFQFLLLGVKILVAKKKKYFILDFAKKNMQSA